MKKIVPGGDHSLQIRPADQRIGKELKVVKLTREQAIAFQFDLNAAGLMNKYPRLSDGEQYEGYIAIVYGNQFIDVCWLKGAFIKATDPYKYVYEVREAVKDGIYYDVIYTTSKGKKLTGEFKYFWGFNGCKFAKECHDMQEEHILDASIDAEELDRSLKAKLVNSFIASTPTEVSEEEYLVLRRYLGFTVTDWGEVLHPESDMIRYYK